jgi:predicted RNA binding protein YcfA (HicA-like mRNA interferase family)
MGSTMTSEMIREAERAGWTVSRTGGDHLRFTHPEAATPVFCGTTPSDQRVLRHVRAALRRALRRAASDEARRSA